MDATRADVPFERDWRARYGARWPLVSPFAAHPALLQLHNRYLTWFMGYQQHLEEREATTYQRLLEMEEVMSDDEGDMSEDAASGGGAEDSGDDITD